MDADVLRSDLYRQRSRSVAKLPEDQVQTMPDNPKSSNVTVEKAFDILMSFGEDRQVITAAEVSERFGLPRSTTYRYLATLKAYGLLEERNGGGYKLGPKVFALARAAVRSTSMVEVAKPFLESLSRSSGETVLLNQTIGGEIVVIDCIESRQHLKISYLKGSIIPVPAGASAKTFLAFDPSIDLDAFMAEAPLKKHAAKTVIDRKILTRKIMEARQLGYAVNDEEIDVGVRAVAAPIFIDGKASYCVSLVGPVVRMPTDQIAAIGDAVKRCAAAVQNAWDSVRV
jgi:DNA-binding IclR family transcriptional regulator